MTDEELQSSWPDLAAVVSELRRIDAALADRLVNAVQYSSTQAWRRVIAAGAPRRGPATPVDGWTIVRICTLAAAFIGMVGCAAYGLPGTAVVFGIGVIASYLWIKRAAAREAR